ncbi:DcrB-related protein [Erwinia sp. HDF1-3R]|uniref:DcrB-related protein n=1 Tax=Erwinia sp. HDF1-3R TaxID=3141543 RepID=UPI0031F4A934
MAKYQLQEASVELPDVFKDRTMNLFTLSENNASEFTFVVSRATAKSDDTLQSISSRLVKEMTVTLQGFVLASSQPVLIDGQPATELFYHFKNGHAAIWQKQSVVLLNEERQGRKMVCFIGTCPDSFDEYYQKQYDTIINSIRFRQEGKDDFISQPLSATSEKVYFALDNDSKELFVFETLNGLYQHIDLQRALNGAYLFYDAAGHPLHIAPLPKAREQETTRYALWTTSPKRAQQMSSVMLVCRSIKGSSMLNTAEAIAAFIQANGDV